MKADRIVLMVAYLLAAVAVQASTIYEMDRIGRLPDDGYSYAISINNDGQVLGSSMPYGANDVRGAFLYTQTAGMVDIQVAGQFDLPGDINNNGQVVGTADSGFGPRNAIVREANGGLVPLNGLPGAYDSYAFAINDDGWVVGTSGDFAVVWEGDVVAQLIGGTAGSHSYAMDINSNGSVAWVESLYTNGQWVGTHSYVWNQGSNTLLQALNAGDNCQAAAINGSGMIVGNSGRHAVVWSIDGTVVLDLGIGAAYEINNGGLIVGVREDKAVLWNPDGSIAADLGALAGENVPSTAYGINDSGQIVGAAGYDEYQNMEAVLWELVPEPSSLLVLACGITGISALTLKRRRAGR
ncbi:MAG TPA: PEP-CTERM sorting domain-containing protein [Armatimonadota bacterium]|nr:PEP-CTERM sorting domain-containing protein [Armatimonadota bacterium]